jgi:NADH-quinone oxidoreductase subunit B
VKRWIPEASQQRNDSFRWLGDRSEDSAASMTRRILSRIFSGSLEAYQSRYHLLDSASQGSGGFEIGDMGAGGESVSDDHPGARRRKGSGISSSRSLQPTRLESLLAWARSRSLDVLPFSPACCSGASFESAYGPRHDADRYRSGLPSFAPRHADLLLVSGPVTPRLVPVLKRIYSEMIEPRWVVALGNCACSERGYSSYGRCGDIEDVMGVDLWVAGCPPSPGALIEGLLKLRREIRQSPSERHPQPGPTP